jgi:hypothetical protein
MTEHTPPTVAEIAALTARLRALSTTGAAADPAERARFLADKDALIARITAASHDADPAPLERADYRTFTPDQAAAELVDRRMPPEHAPAIVELYLDGLSWERGWSQQDQWEIDDDDLAVMLNPPPLGAELTSSEPSAERGLTGAEGSAIDAGPALTAEEAARELTAAGGSLDDARALVRNYLDDVSERVGASVHRWGLDEADLNDIRAARRPPSTVDDEQERRDQLNRWHAADSDETRDLAQADGQECPT